MASRRTPSDTPKPRTKKPAAAAVPAQPVTVPPVATPAAGVAVEGATPTAPPSRKAAPRAKRAAVSRPVITADMRRGMIAEAAYLRAERRGFAPGHEDEDWLAAEAEVDRLLSADRRVPQ
jgi:DUF2934 family protein